MKLFILALLFTTSFAYGKNLQVQEVEYGFLDHQGQKTMCLSVFYDVDTKTQVALVEDLHDCFWARKAKKSLGEVIVIPDQYFKPVASKTLEQHLLSYDCTLEFYYSDDE